MKRALTIVLVGGILIFAMHSEIFARGGGGGGGGRGGGGGGGSRGGGGGGGGAARSGGGFSPSAGAARPAAPSASARPSAGGQKAAAARPAAPAAGAKGATRPAGGAQAAARPSGGAAAKSAGAAQRPAAGGAAANVAAGGRPTSGQLNSFLAVPGSAGGAAGAAAAAGAARAPAQPPRREVAAPRPIFCKAGGRKSRREQSVAPLSAPLPVLPPAARGQTLVGLELLARIYPKTAPSGSKTVASDKAPAINGATKFAISMSKTTPVISGRRTLVGLPMPSPVPSRGRLGVR